MSGDLFEMRRLSVLLMRNNPLREIPSDIEKLQHLHTAVFSFCQLTALPQEYDELHFCFSSSHFHTVLGHKKMATFIFITSVNVN